MEKRFPIRNSRYKMVSTRLSGIQYNAKQTLPIKHHISKKISAPLMFSGLNTVKSTVTNTMKLAGKIPNKGIYLENFTREESQ